jgi:hypothetical protein
MPIATGRHSRTGLASACCRLQCSRPSLSVNLQRRRGIPVAGADARGQTVSWAVLSSTADGAQRGWSQAVRRDMGRLPACLPTTRPAAIAPKAPCYDMPRTMTTPARAGKATPPARRRRARFMRAGCQAILEQSSPTSSWCLLYYAEWPLRRPRAAPTAQHHVFAAPSAHPLIINFAGDVRMRAPRIFHHLRSGSKPSRQACLLPVELAAGPFARACSIISSSPGAPSHPSGTSLRRTASQTAPRHPPSTARPSASAHGTTPSCSIEHRPHPHARTPLPAAPSRHVSSPQNRCCATR